MGGRQVLESRAVYFESKMKRVIRSDKASFRTNREEFKN